MADVLVELVCGPTGPLPGISRRYRLVARLGSGAQADVYRAVRLCEGVASAPVTVKVFRGDPRRLPAGGPRGWGDRPPADELRDWDRGDAVLMDLNSRGVPGICRRTDGFCAPPPHRPDESPRPDTAVPYQVYDYLPGVDLPGYLCARGERSHPGPSAAAPGAGTGFPGEVGAATGAAPEELGARPAGRLSAVAALATLAGVLGALHRPDDPTACPVLHRDVSPANVLVLPTGEVRLIDFTRASYWHHDGTGPADDVYGFGSVAYLLVTGVLPHGIDGGAGRHPVLVARPALRDVLLAPLADRPEDRPATDELPGWLDRVAALVRSTGAPAPAAVDWVLSEPVTPTWPLAPVRPLPHPTFGGGSGWSATFGGGADWSATFGGGSDWSAALGGGAGWSAALGGGAGWSAAPGGGAGAARRIPDPRRPADGGGRHAGAAMRGRAAVPVGGPDGADTAPAPHPDPPPHRPTRPPVRDRMKLLRRGGGWSWFGVGVAFVGWGLWALADRKDHPYVPLLGFALALVVAAGLFAVLRLVGRVVVERWLGRRRRGAVLAHLGTALFLVAVGVAYLAETPWVLRLVDWFQSR